MNKWLVRSVAFLSALGVAFAAPTAASWAASSVDIAAMIDGDNLYFDVEQLSQTPRTAATETEFAVASYLENRLRSYGYQTRLQPFFYYDYRQPKTLALRVSGSEGENWNLSAVPYAPNGERSGQLLACGDGSREAFQSLDVRGKVALIDHGSIPLGEKVRNAAAAGAAAVIIINDGGTHMGSSIEEPLDTAVPGVLLSREEAGKLLSRLHAGESLQVTIEVSGSTILKRTSYNVEAVRKPSKGIPSNILLVGAHHDSVPASPGANDNASGVAALLEIARVLADQPIDAELRFVSFGASEEGQRGSFAYVRSLSAEEKKRMTGVFQIERVGSSDAGDFLMDTADGKSNPVTEAGSKAGVIFSRLEKEGGEAESDHTSFTKAGIPAALFYYGPAEAWHHQPEDTIQRIDRAKLLRATKMIGTAVCEVIRR